ncbi:ribosome assembly cofactor RimP [Thermophagus sp. OGC60D27]|uniref:ribosome assembly cofactor RimP n=1 Tax=Thermophagus sp. OGC60D27 TaxID=3458415 RepID=UPI00403770E7
MITKEQIVERIDSKVKEDGAFIVEVNVRPNNKIEVLVDSEAGISISYCGELSRFIEAAFDREEEDFELEVSSPGIGYPFKVKEQYYKNLTRPVEVLTSEGKVFKGILKEVNEDGFAIEEEKKVKIEGKKKKELKVFRYEFNFDAVKRVIELLKL